ncbi:putative peptidoglycan binding protein [Paludibacterium purpuratum]|uniref:Putative peptidoglycan binding protein n=2 Tax=Paludibacterium purpuratum TaxID=1144873 RepID=A0A4R7B332_9NEIS|nr:putative peptidoglycan binding protein [Paludibacterium purpuratum]
MEFANRGTPLTEDGLTQVITTLEINRAAFWAVLQVESSGFGFLPDRRPKILFERHIFHRESQGRFSKAFPDISNPQHGGYSRGASEYERLQRAIALDREAALKSASWGIAQIMGFNYAIVGFTCVEDMVQRMVEGGEDRQIMAMAKFIQHNQLVDALRQDDWPRFARGYNGANYARNRYDEKLADAYAKAQRAEPSLELRTAQAALLYLGFDPGPIDGIQGTRTRTALRDFQTRNRLQETGELDGTSRTTLMAAAFPPAIGA